MTVNIPVTRCGATGNGKMSLGGYAHRDYARSLAGFGRPRELSGCGGWVLKRAIPGYAREDAMGCYPLFVCRDWSRLKSDLEALAAEVVCIGLVTDPFGNYTVEQLHECFADRVLPFKEHYVLDLHRPAEGTRWVYLCGRIFDREAYSRIAESRGLSHSTYFPAYRAGEFSCPEAPPFDSRATLP